VAIAGKDERLIPYGTTNFGSPPDLLDSLITPNDRFFVRSNGSTPQIDADEWRLRVTGLVANQLEIGLADLKAMPHRTVTSFLECAGNSRTRFSPPAEGTAWRNDAIGNAAWTGTPLRNVLARAGLSDDAVEVIGQGADLKEMRRALPVATALNPNVMLVWEMNGQPLPAEHGGPVRLLVPGWGGIASTKWIVELEATATPFVGAYQGDLYVIVTPNGERIAPVREMPVKSIVTNPLGTIQAGNTTIHGYAWSGYGRIERVEVSLDGGESWTDATIDNSAGALAWASFSFPWDAESGVAHIQTRATDQRGLTQPVTANWNEKGYQMNAIQDVEITVTE
jgi:DMSO/TMAO reductase YedYZ molybdopterin-dependent catalytic subunit